MYACVCLCVPTQKSEHGAYGYDLTSIWMQYNKVYNTKHKLCVFERKGVVLKVIRLQK